MLTTTAGSSDPAMYESPSCIREIPGPEEEVITRFPEAAVPRIMLIVATSLSACRNVPSRAGRCAAMYSGMSFWGVIG